MAVKADKLPDGTSVPALSGVWFTPFSMGRHPLIWGPDPLVFRPERWLERDSFPSAYEFPHFFAGPRLCLGKNVAIMQAALLLSNILLKVTTTSTWTTRGKRNGVEWRWMISVAMLYMLHFMWCHPIEWNRMWCDVDAWALHTWHVVRDMRYLCV